MFLIHVVETILTCFPVVKISLISGYCCYKPLCSFFLTSWSPVIEKSLENLIRCDPCLRDKDQKVTGLVEDGRIEGS
jgi:hypothetical protein